MISKHPGVKAGKFWVRAAGYVAIEPDGLHLDHPHFFPIKIAFDTVDYTKSEDIVDAFCLSPNRKDVTECLRVIFEVRYGRSPGLKELIFKKWKHVEPPKRISVKLLGYSATHKTWGWLFENGCRAMTLGRLADMIISRFDEEKG